MSRVLRPSPVPASPVRFAAGFFLLFLPLALAARHALNLLLDELFVRGLVSCLTPAERRPWFLALYLLLTAFAVLVFFLWGRRVRGADEKKRSRP